ncbi:MAG: hypothetical protein ACYDCL_09620 [Myxococcales bacterium]
MAKKPPPSKRLPTRYSVDYKLSFLQKADACSKWGELAALLRKEGVSRDNLGAWRRSRATWLTAQERGLSTGTLSSAAAVVAAREAKIRAREERLLTAILGRLRALREQRTHGPTYGPGLVATRGRSWEQIKADVVAAVLRETKGNRRAAATQLGDAKSTLLKWIAEYDLVRVGREGED